MFVKTSERTFGMLILYFICFDKRMFFLMDFEGHRSESNYVSDKTFKPTPTTTATSATTSTISATSHSLISVPFKMIEIEARRGRERKRGRERRRERERNQTRKMIKK